MTIRINVLDSQTKSLYLDAGLTAKDLCAKLALKLGLQDYHNFALYLVADSNLDLGMKFCVFC
jgi:hypothetical protein